MTLRIVSGLRVALWAGLAASALLVGSACNPEPSARDYAQTRGGRVDVFFNDPGSRLANVWSPDAVRVMLDMVDSASVSIDMAVMGFTYSPLVEALIRAHDRGVRVRMVGDAKHIHNLGYQRFFERHVPLVLGNQAHIMHNKFLVVDDRFVMTGTANFSVTDLKQNSNNFAIIDSPHVVADFKAEFEQMWGGVFGHRKSEFDNARVYELGDTTVEVWFSPHEDVMGRILELVDGAQDSIRFTIFAFTKDQVGSAFIRKQAEFEARDLADGVDLDADFRERRSVAGVIDQSQLHSNGQYHEAYRLLGAGIPLRMDGIDSGSQPGDYQAGGGRLHSKTMLIDVHGENPIVISGSFNWSAAATQSNDEYLLIFHGPRIAKQFDTYFESLWMNGRRFGHDFVGETVPEGGVTINEVMWYGVHDNDVDGFDEFIEIKNHTDQPIRLDMWQIANADDVIVGFPPGSTIAPHSEFVVVDHVLEPFMDGLPQARNTAYLGGDLVVNAFNDNRQARLYLKDGALELFLKDPAATIVDVAGDGGPAFAGGPDGSVVRSMERLPGTTDGTVKSSWKASRVSEGGALVNPDYRHFILATPGEPNSP